MINIFHKVELNLPFESFILQIALVLICASVINLITNQLLRYATKVTSMTKNILDDAIIKAAKAPLSFLVWIVALKLCSDIWITNSELFGFTFLTPFKIAIASCFIWFLLRLINIVTKEIETSGKIENSEFEHTTIDAFSKLAKITVVVFGLLIIAHILGFSISGILAAGGAGGLVIGFAAKDLFANFFGGLTIYLDRPFNVGDWIRCNEKNIEGTVEYIGWRHTRIRGFNKNPIYVPNSIFTTVVVENPSRMTHRRLKEIIGIRYNDLKKMVIITDEIRNMLDNDLNIDHTIDKIVNFEKFNSSSVDFLVQAFTTTTNVKDFYKIKQDILLKISDIIEKNGAEIAFPTQTIYLEK